MGYAMFIGIYYFIVAAIALGGIYFGAEPLFEGCTRINNGVWGFPCPDGTSNTSNLNYTSAASQNSTAQQKSSLNEFLDTTLTNLTNQILSGFLCPDGTGNSNYTFAVSQNSTAQQKSPFNEFVDQAFEKFPKEANLTRCTFAIGLKKVGLSVAIGIAASISTSIFLPVVTCICLSCLGFGLAGVRALSIAACCHSAIGNVEPGSCFACCQSTGASGLGCGVVSLFAIPVGVALSIASLYVMFTQ